MNEVLRIAVQKSGRLHDGSMELLRACGLAISNGRDQLKLRVPDFPVELLFLRDDDIPQYVTDGVADAGMVGENVVAEKNLSGGIVRKLGFARCRLALAVPKGVEYTGPAWLEGKNIATSYPVITGHFLKSRGINARLHVISGSVEIAPGIGLADAICDLVSTGSTLFSNGLKEAETVMASEAVIIAGENLSAGKSAILQKLLFRINAVQSARNNKYVLMNIPTDAIARIASVIPGMNSPTIMPLGRPGWSSLHAVVNENDFWEKIDLLKSLGAEGILVVPIEKMIP